jgi:hypothetical protein
MSKYKQGYYIPIKPEKWIITESFDSKGKAGIKYRSSWEHKFMKFCDYNDNIIKVNSEGVVIPYISPVDNKYHRYYMDFIVETADSRIILIEIKPYSQCIPPKPPKNDTDKSRLSFQKAIMTYAVNQAKWEAAGLYAEERGWMFKIITEKELF